MPSHKASPNLFTIDPGSKFYFLSHGRVLDFLDFLIFSEFLGAPEIFLSQKQKRPNAEPQGVPKLFIIDSGGKFYFYHMEASCISWIFLKFPTKSNNND